jgi:hypothetical protein
LPSTKAFEKEVTAQQRNERRTEQPVLIFDRGGPCGQDVGQGVVPRVGLPRGDLAVIVTHIDRIDSTKLQILADIGQEEVEPRSRTTARPLLVWGIEINPNALAGEGVCGQ